MPSRRTNVRCSCDQRTRIAHNHLGGGALLSSASTAGVSRSRSRAMRARLASALMRMLSRAMGEYRNRRSVRRAVELGGWVTAIAVSPRCSLSHDAGSGIAGAITLAERGLR